MTANGIATYLAILTGLAVLSGVVIAVLRFGESFFNQSVAMVATVGTHAERFLRRAGAAFGRGRAKVVEELEEMTSKRKGVVLLGLLVLPVWVVSVRTARRLDAQLLQTVFESKALASGLAFLIITFTSIAGFIVTELISPVRLPFFDGGRRTRIGLVAALLVLVPIIITIQINLATDRAETTRVASLAKVTANVRTLNEVLKQTTAVDERAVLESRLDAFKDQTALIEGRAERQTREGITGALTASGVEALTSFSLPIAFFVALIAGLWVLDALSGFAAGAMALATLLIRAVPGLFRRAPGPDAPAGVSQSGAETTVLAPPQPLPQLANPSPPAMPSVAVPGRTLNTATPGSAAETPTPPQIESDPAGTGPWTPSTRSGRRAAF